MQGDLAIVAQVSFKRAQESGELGHDLEQVREAKEIFSGSAGREATAGYFTLLELRERHPDAVSLQAVLIYSTWQQNTEATIPANFQWYCTAEVIK